MKTRLLVSIVVVLIGGFFAPSRADNNKDRNHDKSFVKFSGGIGVIPISNVAVDATTGAVTVTRNTVHGVNPPGQIWRIKDLEATIKNNGDIEIDGEGLLLAGGNNIGAWFAAGVPDLVDDVAVAQRRTVPGVDEHRAGRGPAGGSEIRPPAAVRLRSGRPTLERPQRRYAT